MHRDSLVVGLHPAGVVEAVRFEEASGAVVVSMGPQCDAVAARPLRFDDKKSEQLGSHSNTLFIGEHANPCQMHQTGDQLSRTVTFPAGQYQTHTDQ